MEENFAIRRAIRCDVAAEALHASGKLRLRVFGGSMLPSIWPGDVLLIQRAEPADMEPGELALYTRKGDFVVHRIVRRDGDALTARGDALAWDDEPVPFRLVLGKVAMIEHGGAQFVPQKEPGALQRLFSWLMRRFSPFKIAALRWNSLRLKLDRAGRNRETSAA